MANTQLLTPQQEAASTAASDALPEVQIRNFGPDTLYIAISDDEVKTIQPFLNPEMGERLEVRQAKSARPKYLKTNVGELPMIEATDVSIGYSKATSSSQLSNLEVRDLNVNDKWAFNILPMKDALKLMGGFKPKSRVGFGYVDPRTARRYECPTQHTVIVVVAMGDELRKLLGA